MRKKWNELKNRLSEDIFFLTLTWNVWKIFLSCAALELSLFHSELFLFFFSNLENSAHFPLIHRCCFPSSSSSSFADAFQSSSCWEIFTFSDDEEFVIFEMIDICSAKNNLREEIIASTYIYHSDCDRQLTAERKSLVVQASRVLNWKQPAQKKICFNLVQRFKPRMFCQNSIDIASAFCTISMSIKKKSRKTVSDGKLDIKKWFHGKLVRYVITINWICGLHSAAVWH